MKATSILASLFSVIILAFASIAPLFQSSADQILVYYDDFESETVKWQGVGSGSVSRSSTHAFNGDASLNVSSLTWALEEALKQVGSPGYPMPIATVDFWFSYSWQNVQYFSFGLEYCSANRQIWHRSCIILCNPWSYEAEDGSWLSLNCSVSLDLPADYSVWHHAQLTVDLQEGEYVELVIDDYKMDLSGLECYDRTAESSPVCWGVFYPYFYNFGGSSFSSILIDDVAVFLEG